MVIAKSCKMTFSNHQSNAECQKLLKRGWVFASSWLQIDPIWSATEVDNSLQSQKLERKCLTWAWEKDA